MTRKEQQAAIAALNLPASKLVKHQKKTFRKDYTKGSKPYSIVAEVRWDEVRWDDQCGNGRNSFAITADLFGPDRYPGETTVTHKTGKTLWCYGGGCCHEEIAEQLPELAHLIKWHLFDPSGPLHYVSNTAYLAGDRDCWGLHKGEFRQHTSRGPYQADGVPGVPHWELVMHGMPEKREVYSATKPEPITITCEWVPSGRTGEGKERELDKARSAACWPNATDEDLTAPGLEARLIARLPALVAEMKKDIETLGFEF